jgi:hypothetical protein
LLCTATSQWLHKLDVEVTARPALRQASKIWPRFSVDAAATWQLKRSLLYQLDFYANKELPEWKPATPKPAWLFVEPQFEAQARALGFSCPDYVVYPAVVSCKNSISAAHP